MAVIKTNSEDVRTLARLMRAEAEGEGEQGMLMVGNVGVNRILGNCLDFQGIRLMNDMVFQSPGGFEATQKGYFYQRARDRDIRLARRVINGKKYARRPMHYGFSDRQETVRTPGITRPIPDVLKPIAFLARLYRIVLPSIRTLQHEFE